MTSTVALFLAVVAVIAIVAIFFACYQSHMRSRELQAVAQEQERSGLNAAVVFSEASDIPLGPGADRASARRLRQKFPTPAPIIRNLPTLLFDPSTGDPGEKDEEPPTCVICFCEYENQDKIKLLPCLHQYHEACIDAWLQRDHICPICQADVVLAAGLSLHDWSTHTQAAVEMLSGSRAHNLVSSSAADAATDEGGTSVHQPETPSAAPPNARAVTPAEAAGTEEYENSSGPPAASGLNMPVMQSFAVSLQQQEQQQNSQQSRVPSTMVRSGSCRCRERVAQVTPQQQSQTTAHSTAAAQHPFPTPPSTTAAVTAAPTVTEGTSVIMWPSWFARGGSSAASIAVHTATAARSTVSHSAGSSSSSSSMEVLSAPVSPITPAAAAAAVSSAPSGAAHLVLEVRQDFPDQVRLNSR